MDTLLVEEKSTWVEEKEWTNNFVESLHLMHEQLQAFTVKVRVVRVQVVVEYFDSTRYFKDTLEVWTHIT